MRIRGIEWGRGDGIREGHIAVNGEHVVVGHTRDMEEDEDVIIDSKIGSIELKIIGRFSGNGLEVARGCSVGDSGKKDLKLVLIEKVN